MPTFSYQNDRDKPMLPAGDNGFTGLNSHTQASLLSPGTVARLENGRMEADGLLVTRPGLAWWNAPKLYSDLAMAARVGSVFFYDTPEKEALLAWYERSDNSASSLIIIRSDGTWPDSHTFKIIWTQPVGATPDPLLPSPLLSSKNWSEQVLYQELPAHTQWAQLVDRAYLAGSFVCDGNTANAATRDGVAPSVALGTGDYFLWSFWWNGAGWERRPVKTPARFQHLTTLRFRLFASPGRQSEDRETLWCSDVLDGTTWSNISSIVGEGNGDPIMGLAVYDDRLLCVVKERSVWLVDVSGDDFRQASILLTPASWVMSKVASGTGCVAPRTVIACDGDVYWLSRQGLMGLSRVRESGRTEAATDLGLPVRDLLDRVNWPVAEHTASAAYYDGRIHLALPIDGSGHANALAIFHVARQSWEGIWTFEADIDRDGWGPAPDYGGWPADVELRALTTAWWGGVETLHFGGINVHKLSEADASDLTTGVIAATVETRAYDHGLPFDEKKGHIAEITFWNSECDGIKIEAIRDGLPGQELAADVRTHTSPQTPIQTPFVTVLQTALRRRYHLGFHGPYRDIQFRLTQTAKGRLRLRTVSVTATARKNKTLS